MALIAPIVVQEHKIKTLDRAHTQMCLLNVLSSKRGASSDQFNYYTTQLVYLKLADVLQCKITKTNCVFFFIPVIYTDATRNHHCLQNVTYAELPRTWPRENVCQTVKNPTTYHRMRSALTKVVITLIFSDRR